MMVVAPLLALLFLTDACHSRFFEEGETPAVVAVCGTSAAVCYLLSLAEYRMQKTVGRERQVGGSAQYDFHSHKSHMMRQ